MAVLNRLAAVADMLIKGEPAADIGADHAGLSIYLIEMGLVPCVIIGELGDAPYKRALEAVRESGLEESIELRQGNGLQVLQAGEVGSVAIAGMGGDTILDILSYDWDKTRSFKRFVFQPMSRSGVLRQAMAVHGWKIIEERVVHENGHFFVLIASEPGNIPYYLDDLEIDIGYLILKADNDIKRMYLKYYLAKYYRISAELNYSRDKRNQKLLFDYHNKIRRLEDILGVRQD